MEEKKKRGRDLVFSSTKTRMVYKALYQWLYDTKNIMLSSRVFRGAPTGHIEVKYSHFCEDSDYKSLILLGAYNYAGLNFHPSVIQAAQEALNKYGTATGGVRLLNGTSDLHVQFEEKLAKFLGMEAAVTYSSGYSANTSALNSLCSDKDIVFSDEFNHQSLMEGLKLSEAKIIKFPHLNYNALETALKNVAKAQRKFIVTDGVFSMDGDVARLDIIVELAYKYNAFIIVDDAHATAAYGPNGKGTPAYFGVESEIDVLTGSLSKGIPAVGGFVAGSKQTIEIMRYGSNGYIFSSSVPASALASASVVLDILEQHPEIQDKIHHNQRFLRDGIKAIGLNAIGGDSAIIPIIMPTREITSQFVRKLHEKGVYVNGVCFPAVSRHHPRLRLNVNALLSDDDIKAALSAMKKTAEELNLITASKKEICDGVAV